MTDVDNATKCGWPTLAEAATADRLILHSAWLAFHEDARREHYFREYMNADRDTPDFKVKAGRYIESIAAMLAQAQVATLLHEVQKRSRDEADKLALEIWSLTEDGGVMHELMWDRLDERGIKPDEVWDEAEKWATEHAPTLTGEDGK